MLLEMPATLCFEHIQYLCYDLKLLMKEKTNICAWRSLCVECLEGQKFLRVPRHIVWEKILCVFMKFAQKMNVCEINMQ